MNCVSEVDDDFDLIGNKMDNNIRENQCYSLSSTQP